VWRLSNERFKCWYHINWIRGVYGIDQNGGTYHIIKTVARVGRSGVRIPADPAGNGIFPESFRPVPRILPREPAGKPTEGGSSIPDGISPYLKQDYSNFFPGTENLGKRMDLTGNKREPPGNAPEI
jgi:hypothetical protein